MGLPSFARYAGYSYMDSTRGGTQTRRAPEQHGAEPGPPDLGTVPLKQKKLEWDTRPGPTLEETENPLRG